MPTLRLLPRISSIFYNSFSPSSMSSPPSSSSSPGFPWQHSFPPFYTLQPHRETRKKQLDAWRSIVLDYCQRKGLSVVDVNEIAKSDLFVNKEIKYKK